MPLRLLTQKQLSAVFSNFTQRLAKVRLTPLSLNPTLLMQSQVRSSLKRRVLDPGRSRARKSVASPPRERTETTPTGGPRVEPAARRGGVDIPGMKGLVDLLNEDLVLEVRLSIPVLRPVEKRLGRRVWTPTPQLFFREGKDRSDPGMLAISGPGFSLLTPPGKVDTHSWRQEGVQEVRSDDLQRCFLATSENRRACPERFPRSTRARCLVLLYLERPLTPECSRRFLGWDPQRPYLQSLSNDRIQVWVPESSGQVRTRCGGAYDWTTHELGSGLFEASLRARCNIQCGNASLVAVPRLRRAIMSSWTTGLSPLFKSLQESLAEVQQDIGNLDDFHQALGRKTFTMEQLRDKGGHSGDLMTRLAHVLRIPKGQLRMHGPYVITLVVVLVGGVVLSLIICACHGQSLSDSTREQQGTEEERTALSAGAPLVVGEGRSPIIRPRAFPGAE